MGLQGQHILSTRDSLGPDHLQKMLSAAGAIVQAVPTIELLPPDSWAAFDEAAAQIDTFDWMLFTSVNAVLQTALRLAVLGVPLPTKLKIAVVGKKTARQVDKQGWSVDLVPKTFQAESLVESLQGQVSQGTQIFFPRALVAREWLPAQLLQFGAVVQVAPVYQNRPALGNKEALKAALATGDLDWITFTSASTVNNFKLILGELPAVLPKIASIGQITTEAIQQAGLTPTVTADPQTLDGLLQAMEDYEPDSDR